MSAVAAEKPYPTPRIRVPRFSEENGFYTTEERSKLMAKIKGRNNKTEVAFRKWLWALGCRYRLNVKTLPGKPDLVFRKARLAVFVDGDFWHGKNWAERKNDLKSNRDFWIPKIERNIQRDEEVNQLLRAQDWHVLRFWESDLARDPLHAAQMVLDWLEYGVKGYGSE